MTDIVRNIFGYSFHYVATGRLKALYIRRGDKLLYTVRRWNMQRARWDLANHVRPAEVPQAVSDALGVPSDILRAAMSAVDEAERTA